MTPRDFLINQLGRQLPLPIVLINDTGDKKTAMIVQPAARKRLSLGAPRLISRGHVPDVRGRLFDRSPKFHGRKCRQWRQSAVLC